MSDLVDTHAHLQEPDFAGDRDAVLARAAAAGVSRVVVPAVDLRSAEAAIALAEASATVYATAGYHPHEASGLTSTALAALEALLEHPRVVAVGEIGLDYYRTHSPRAAQLSAFDAMLSLAARRAMPVVVHCRDAWDEMLPVLERWSRAAPGPGDAFLGVMHYYSGSLEDARRYAAMGFAISIHTSVTHPRADRLRTVAAALPLEALVIETDSPYGAPQARRGRRNEPAYAVDAAKAIAAARGCSFEAVAAATTANAQRLFRLAAADAGRLAEARA